MIAFHRTALAQQLAQALQGRSLLGDAHNGLFLATEWDKTHQSGREANVGQVLLEHWRDIAYTPAGSN